MAEVLTAEQVLARCVRDMGAQLGPVYHALWNEAVWLHVKWDQYLLLYGHSRERVDLLNQAGSHIFWVVQEAMHDDILVHVARLVDRRRDTLSLHRLPRLVPNGLCAEVTALIEAAACASQSAKAARDQRIAHTNFERALQRANFDPSPSSAELKAALHAIRTVLDRLEMHYCSRKLGASTSRPEAAMPMHWCTSSARGSAPSSRRSSAFVEGGRWRRTLNLKRRVGGRRSPQYGGA